MKEPFSPEDGSLRLRRPFCLRPIGPRRHPRDFLEDAAKCLRLSKAHLLRHGGDRHIALAEQSIGVLDAALVEHVMKAIPDHVLEDLAKVAFAIPRRGGSHLHREWLGVLVMDQIQRSLNIGNTPQIPRLPLGRNTGRRKGIEQKGADLIEISRDQKVAVACGMPTKLRRFP